MASPARVVIFDTETTGLSPATGDRIVEIGCVELIGFDVGRTYHSYINPQRDVPEEVIRVHGLTGHFLADKPLFSQVHADLMDFFGADMIVAHNAEFDRRFLNAELELCGIAAVPKERFIDTLERAKAKLRAGMRLSLDGLSKHYRLDQRGFDLNARKGAGGHGALIDAKMLAEIYIELQGGRVQQFSFGDEPTKNAEGEAVVSTAKIRPRLSPLPLLSTAEERALHDQFNNELGGGNPWSN